MKQIYIRRIKSGGLHILQLIAFKWVLSYTRNKCWFNGEKGRTIEIKRRSSTAL